MVCSFCGTENRSENKFCGICGVRLERRQAERRSAPRTASLHCVACNTINEPGYKFCGNCGTRLDRRVGERRGAEVSAGLSSAKASDVAASRTVDRRQSAPVVVEEHPAREGPIHREPAMFRSEVTEHHGIQGPSFLGLSDDPDHVGDYLLEDEGSSRGGLRKLVLVAILAAIIGLIFVQWRSSLHANPKHSTPATNSPSSAPAPSPQSGTQAPASAIDDEGKKNEPAAMAQEPALPVSDAGKSGETNAEASPSPESTESPAGKSLDVADRSTDPPPPAESTATPEIPADQKPSSTLLRAQQFLQGKGVQQNCEQGLIYLRAAAQKNEPAAAVQMGALYAAGHCVQQDKVMAYRWFNAAHELQPANQWIQRNLNQLWAQMSEQEHRLAAY